MDGISENDHNSKKIWWRKQISSNIGATWKCRYIDSWKINTIWGKNNKEKRTNDLDIENKYTVTTVPEELLDELGDGKDSIISGSQFIVSKTFILDGEKAAFIDIIGDENNPYLIKSETLEKISNYNSEYLIKVEE